VARLHVGELFVRQQHRHRPLYTGMKHDGKGVSIVQATAAQVAGMKSTDVHRLDHIDQLWGGVAGPHARLVMFSLRDFYLKVLGGLPAVYSGSPFTLLTACHVSLSQSVFLS